jgi:tripartite-type tricarboxylate transporter receptor subunit TctC
MTRIARRSLAVLTMLAASAAHAQVVKIIVPTPPGGGTDGFFRIVGKEAEPFLKQSVMIENVPGAGGTIGVGKMVTSKPDGLTLAGIWSSPLTATPHTLKATPYTPNDYVPVIELSHTPYVMCVDAKFPAASGPELVAELKKSPDKYTFGNDGIGGTGQLSAARVFKALGLKVRDVPFKGAGETLTNFMGGHVDIYVGSPAPILPSVANGKSKCLIVTSAERLPALPNASGLKDLGIAGEETMLWRAILVPKGTPPDVVSRIESAFEQAMTTPATKAYVEKAGEIVQIRKGAELRKMLDTEYASLGTVAKGLNLQAQ